MAKDLTTAFARSRQAPYPWATPRQTASQCEELPAFHALSPTSESVPSSELGDTAPDILAPGVATKAARVEGAHADEHTRVTHEYRRAVASTYPPHVCTCPFHTMSSPPPAFVEYTPPDADSWALPIRVFFRAWAIVAFTAMNVSLISKWSWGGAFVTSFCISGLWWQNSHMAAHKNFTGAWAIYGLGAACGTTTGMLAAWLLLYIFGR